MATAISVTTSGTISSTRASVLVSQRAAVVVKSAGAAQRLHVFRASRIVSDCEAAFFRGVKCEAAMAGKDMQLEQTAGSRAGTSTNLLVVGPGVLGSLVGRRWLEVANWSFFRVSIGCVLRVQRNIYFELFYGIRLWT